MNAPDPRRFFVAGGTLRPGTSSYVTRAADGQFLRYLSEGEYCYVLTARQMGKSSLMVRTKPYLEQQGMRTAIVDLTEIGTRVSAYQWYLGVLTRVNSQLDLNVDLNAWWARHAGLGLVQRFSEFLTTVVARQSRNRVVIFIDEIDSTLGLDFSDEFFAAVRAIYNARALRPENARLTFALLGCATPDDLIRDKNRTPLFNIGRHIDLTEFSRQDASVLERGLEAIYPGQSRVIFDRIFHWTNGHPYLTQKLCVDIVARPIQGRRIKKQVDERVEMTFLSERARKETNLQFVRENVESSPLRPDMFELYERVHRGKKVDEDTESLAQNQLKLFGLVRVERGRLTVRNKIYNQVFNRDWVRSNFSGEPGRWRLR